MTGDYYYLSPETDKARQRTESMTNPLYAPGAAAGVSYLRGGNYSYGCHAGISRDVLDRMWEAEHRS